MFIFYIDSKQIAYVSIQYISNFKYADAKVQNYALCFLKEFLCKHSGFQIPPSFISCVLFHIGKTIFVVPSLLLYVVDWLKSRAVLVHTGPTNCVCCAVSTVEIQIHENAAQCIIIWCVCNTRPFSPTRHPFVQIIKRGFLDKSGLTQRQRNPFKFQNLF